MSIPYSAGEPLARQQFRELDVLAIEHVGIPGMVLMENAGRGAAEILYAALVHPAAEPVALLCGPGNNGGDGFVIARHLHNAGAGVHVILGTPRGAARGDALINLRILERMGVAITAAADDAGVLPAALRIVAEAALIVDALLGTGAGGAPRGVMADLIRAANAAPRARRIAIDLPSGLDADTGSAHEPCFRADMTITMVAPKIGFSLASGPAHVGAVRVVDIGVPRELIPGRGAP